MTSSTVENTKEETTSLTLTGPEAAELRLALGIHVTDLRMEIGHTDSYDLREELKVQRALLEGVLRRLGGPVVTGQGAR